MTNWEEMHIKDMCSFVSRGITPKYSEDGILVINQKCIRDNRVDLKPCKFTSKDTKIKNEKYVRYGDILINSTGSGTLGRVAIYRHKNIVVTADGHVTIIHTADNINSIFLGYYLHSIEKIIENLGTGSTNQTELSTNDLKRLKLKVPDLETQTKIADILSAYDDLIENNNKRIAILEKAAQELYKEWFVRFHFPGYKKAKFENGLPVGWERKKISTYYNTCSGGTPSRSKSEYFENGVYPWVKTGEIKDSIIIETEEQITDQAVKKSSAKLLPMNCVAMAMYGVNIGMLAYFDGIKTCNQACCVFSDKRDFSSKHYLFQYLFSIREYLLLISFGAAQQNLSQDLIKKVKIIMPTDDIVMAFEEKVNAIYNSIRNLMYKNQNLAKQRDLLLPRLMSGKLEV